MTTMLARPAGQEREQQQPDDQKKVPVDRAKSYAGSRGADVAAGLRDGPGQGDEAAQEMRAVQAGDQVEEAVGRVGRKKIAGGREFPPGDQLSGEEEHCREGASMSSMRARSASRRSAK